MQPQINLHTVSSFLNHTLLYKMIHSYTYISGSFSSLWKQSDIGGIIRKKKQKEWRKKIFCCYAYSDIARWSMETLNMELCCSHEGNVWSQWKYLEITELSVTLLSVCLRWRSCWRPLAPWRPSTLWRTAPQAYLKDMPFVNMLMSTLMTR